MGGNISRNIGKNISKKLSSKYSQKFFDHAKRSATDAIKTASQKEIQKTAQANGDFVENKIAHKITGVWKTSPKTIQKQMKKKYWAKDIYRTKTKNY